MAYGLEFMCDKHLVSSLRTRVEELEKEIEVLRAGEKTANEQITWLRKFIWQDTINIHHTLENAIPPFRVGKKQKRAILDSLGHEVGVFVTGQELMAQTFCDWLNKRPQE